MKEIEKVSIGGYAFTLEKDASEAVERYLSGLEAHYLGQEGGKEIMEGIEERMAELLIERCGQSGVATLDTVGGIINILGRPERIEADDPGPERPQVQPKKKLYRDLEHKRIAGVCAGLGNYFSFDVVVIRVVFAALALTCFFGLVEDSMWAFAVVILYGILWIAMPPARTAQERWAMRGDSGTIEDIRRNVRDGVNEMGEVARGAVRSARGSEIGKIILIVLGAVLLLSGVSGLASFSVVSLKGPALFSGAFDRFLDEFALEAPVFYNLFSTPWVMALTILAIVLPLIGLIYLGVRFIFGFQPPRWKPGLVIFVVWLIVVVVLAVLCAFGAVSTEYLEQV